MHLYIAGFGAMKCVGNYGAVNGNNGQISPSIDMLKSQISFSSRSASSLGMLSQISEIEGEEDIGATSPDDGRQGGGNGHGFPYTSWNDTPQLSENFIGLKRGRSGNERMFSELQVCIEMLTFFFLFLFSFPYSQCEYIVVLRMES